jgi:hydrogenase nickel incorporation protein HypA/HybF
MPHEVDMTKALIMSLAEWVDQQQGADSVETVVLQVGKFTCVEPALLLSSFQTQRQKYPWLAGAELRIRDIPFVAFCETCDAEYNPEMRFQYACPTCQSALHTIRSGRELKIECVEWKVR